MILRNLSVCPSNVKVVVIVYVKLKSKKIFHFKYYMMYTMRMKNSYFKDARSVSLYPYNQSQILQYVKYTNEITLPKELQKM